MIKPGQVLSGPAHGHAHCTLERGSGAWAKGRRAGWEARTNAVGGPDTGSQLRVNRQIRAPTVRVVFPDDSHQVC